MPEDIPEKSKCPTCGRLFIPKRNPVHCSGKCRDVAAHKELNAERAARGLRPVKFGRKHASPLPRRTVDRNYDAYIAYIRSPEWQAVRRRFWASKLPKDCYCCGKVDGPKDLHHRTYKNLGNERLMDLVPLCRRCHDDVHRMFKRKPSMSLWGATGAVRLKRHPVYGRKAKAARKAASSRRAKD